MHNDDKKSVKYVSLRQLAGRNFMLSLLLFVILIAIIFVASMRDKENMNMLVETYEDQFRIEQFQASLTNIMIPINEFAMTGGRNNFDSIREAIKAYEQSFARIESIPTLTDDNKNLLAQVDNLMREVMKTANDVADKKITFNQAGQVTVIAQNLVLVAQKKLKSIVKDMEQQLESSAREHEQQATLQLYVLLGFIVFILILLEILNRRLVSHAQVVSKVSSSVAESAGDIIEVNKLQANTTDQQARFMTRVTQGLELIAESGSKIISTTTNLEKNTSTIASFAKGGRAELESSIAGIDHMLAHLERLNRHLETTGLKTEQVYKSLEQVQEIADEAHLLALNASIDGAGQGSSSMTNEVQRMADEIRACAVEIRTTVQDIAATNATVISAVQDEAGDLQGSLDIARRTSDLFSRIEKMGVENSTAASTVAKATRRQNERNQKLLLALKHISELLVISGNKMHAYDEASVRLSEASESLQNLS